MIVDLHTHHPGDVILLVAHRDRRTVFGPPWQLLDVTDSRGPAAFRLRFRVSERGLREAADGLTPEWAGRIRRGSFSLLRFLVMADVRRLDFVQTAVISEECID